MLHNKTFTKGLYMIILDKDISKVGLPDFKDVYLYVNPEDNCCTACIGNETVQTMSTASNAIQSYFEIEDIEAHVHFVHTLENDKDKTYACVIGPLHHLSEDQVNKVEHFTQNKIPGITSNMVGYQLKSTEPFMDLYHVYHDSTFLPKFIDCKQRLFDEENTFLNNIALRCNSLVEGQDLTVTEAIACMEKALDISMKHAQLVQGHQL